MTDIRLAFLSRDGALSPQVRVTAPGGRPRAQRVLLVPGEEVTARWMDAPGQTLAQSRAAALALLAPDLAASADSSVAGMSANRTGARLVVIADRAQVDRWRATASAAGFAPDLIIPDYAVLAHPDPGPVRTARRDGVIVAGGDGLAFAAEPDLARAVLKGRPTEDVDLEAAMLAWARSGGAARAPDLLAGLPTRTEAGNARQSLARSALVAVLALLLAVLAPWIQVWRLDQATADMRREARATVQTLLPNASPGASPRAALQDELSAYRASGGLMLLTGQVLEGLAQTPAADVRALEAIPPGEVRVSLGVSTPDDLSALREHLGRQGFVLEETSVPTADARLAVDLVVRSGP